MGRISNQVHKYNSSHQDELSQQLASMSYSAGKTIPAHTHNIVSREVFYIQEAFLVSKA